MRNFYRLGLILTALVIAGCATTPASKGPINLATLHWPPYIGEELRDGGPATEIVVTALREAGYDAKVHIIPWKDAIGKTALGEYDAVYPAYFSEERFKIYHVSEPFMAGAVALCKLKDKKINYESLESLKPYRIGTVAGYVNAKKFDAADFLNKKVGTSDLENLGLLKQGKLDLLIVDRMVGINLIETHPEQLGKVSDYEFIEPFVGMRDCYLMFPRSLDKSEKRLRGFDEAIRAMREDGRLEKIMRKHGFR
jgi:polar amino acid transport system substrate-binding protein